MSDWINVIIFTAGFLAFFFFFLSRIQRRSKQITQESIDVAKERIKVERESMAVQKETNELLKQVIAKLDKKV